MNLFLIRHAESRNNILKKDQERVSDPELTENGRLQSTYLAEFLQKGIYPRKSLKKMKDLLIKSFAVQCRDLWKRLVQLVSQLGSNLRYDLTSMK